MKNPVITVFSNCQVITETKDWQTKHKPRRFGLKKIAKGYRIHSHFGEIPVATSVDESWFNVENRRGLAYALRSDMKYRKGYKRSRHQEIDYS